jgi:hypothetical protein
MNKEGDWKSPTKTTKKSPQNIDDSNTGNDLFLPNVYVLWCHHVHDKDWSIGGYTKLYTLKTVADFWKLFNNIDKLSPKVNNFFLMKEDTEPIWEHVNNRDGGICSFKIEMDNSLKVYEDLCLRLMCNKLVDNPEDINGISFSPKNNWSIIKIWNKDHNNDLSVGLNPIILNMYRDASIKYICNKPEY